jgi:cytochrome P450
MDTATEPGLMDGRTKIEDYADILEILKSSSFAMVRGIEPPSSHELMNLTLDGQDHFSRRRIESNIFRNDTLTYFEQHALRPTPTGSSAPTWCRSCWSCCTR